MANKAELIERVAGKTNLTKKDVTASVDALFEVIQEALKDGEKVQVIVLVILKFVIVQLVKDAILKLGKKSKSKQAKFLHSNQVKH